MTFEIEIKSLIVEYEINGRRTQILDIPELRIQKGESVLLVGESGIGKTTLLSAMLGLKKTSFGFIKVRDENISEMSGYRLDLFRAKTFGIIFQTFNLIESSSARRNILLPLLLTGRKGQAANDWVNLLIDKVKLNERQNQLPPKLSAGERQRVAVARAIAGGASILIADEPTSNLDKENKEIVLSLFEDHLNRGGTLIMASHEDELKNIAGRIIEIKDFKR